MQLDYYYVLATEKFDQYKFSERISDQFFQYNNSDKFHIYRDSNKKLNLFGDVIAITLSYIGKNIPKQFSNLKYFIVKSHNYSKKSAIEVKKWLERTKTETNSNNDSEFSLYTRENTFARFTLLAKMIYDFSNYSFNSYNYSFIVHMWILIYRKARVNKSLQNDLRYKYWSEVLNYFLIPDAKFKYVDNNSYFNYISSLLKYRFNYNIQ